MKTSADNNLRYVTITYGCQMNLRDTETIEGLLDGAGYQQAFLAEDANVIIVNTCSVRHTAENKVYGKLGELNKLKNQHPDLLIVVSGCMSQLEDNQVRLKKAGVDLVVGTHNLHQLPDLIEQARADRRPRIEVWHENGPVLEGLPGRQVDGFTAFVNVMYGCNNFCSYCIVPYTRGRERSREPEALLDEIKQLVDQGVKEITLLGQNVNSYGLGLERNIDFADLLSLVNEVPGLARIR
ncbi:MAG: MiaB/RimO family radical SAM methylthiotransferase, partial [Methylocystaceae bacterium]